MSAAGEMNDAERQAVALMIDALEAACRGECDYSIRKQQDALTAAVAAGLVPEEQAKGYAWLPVSAVRGGGQ